MASGWLPPSPALLHQAEMRARQQWLGTALNPGCPVEGFVGSARRSHAAVPRARSRRPAPRQGAPPPRPRAPPAPAAPPGTSPGLGCAPMGTGRSPSSSGPSGSGLWGRGEAPVRAPLVVSCCVIPRRLWLRPLVCMQPEQEGGKKKGGFSFSIRAAAAAASHQLRLIACPWIPFSSATL